MTVQLAEAALRPEPRGDEALASVLLGTGSAHALAQALGVPVTEPFVLAALTPRIEERAERTVLGRRLRLRSRTFLEAYRARAVTASAGDTAYVLLTTSRGGRDGALRVLRGLHDDLERSLPHRLVASSAVEGLQHAGAARATVDELTSLAARRGWTGLTDADEVEASWRLEQVRALARTHPQLLQGRITRVVAYDRDQGGDLMRTLRQWFACGGDCTLTGERLGLHVNTVRYRLRRTQEIAGISFDNPDDRLLTELQVRIMDA